MANSTLKKVSVSVKLKNGTDSDGNPKTVGISLGNISKDKFDEDKVLAIIGKLGPCLDKEISSVEKIEVSSIVAG